MQLGQRVKGESASRSAVGFLMGPLQLLVSVPEAGKEPSGTDGVWGYVGSYTPWLEQLGAWKYSGER